MGDDQQRTEYMDNNDDIDTGCMPCAYNTIMSFTLVILIVLLVVYFMIIIIIYYGNKYSIHLLFNLLPSKYIIFCILIMLIVVIDM